jgi:tetraprenyl-beta-curcumene synthase
VQKRLYHWQRDASLCSDDELRKQALASLHNKAFHCQGGAIFAAAHKEREEVLLDLIVAYQTLCDYLDNLCDRANCTNETAFREIHQSLLDALSPYDVLHEYYRNYPWQNDSGYIKRLVLTCRHSIRQLPGYDLIYKDAVENVGFYIDLQVLKHINWNTRRETLQQWAESHLADYPGLLWQEFAAACGSTLGLFALFSRAGNQKTLEEDSSQLVSNYFPWICGLHILLGYFIDQEEDRQGGDLNFMFYYPDQEVMLKRLQVFIQEAHKYRPPSCGATFRKTVVEGLLAMYLSDPKIKAQGLENIAVRLLQTSGRDALYTHRLCRLVRKFL